LGWAESKVANYKQGLALTRSCLALILPPVMNFLSIARKVAMNPDITNSEARRSLKELHPILVLQYERRVLDLIAYTEYVVKYTIFFNYPESTISINTI